MQPAHDVADVGHIAVALQALVDDVDGAVGVAIGVDARSVEAGAVLPEDLATQDLKALAGLVVVVGGFLGGDDGSVEREAGLVDDGVEAGAAFVQKGSHQGDRLGQLRQ